MREKTVASTDITTTSTTILVNTDVQPQVQSVKSRPLPYQNTSRKKTSAAVSRGNESKQESPPYPPTQNLVIPHFPPSKIPPRRLLLHQFLLTPSPPPKLGYHKITSTKMTLFWGVF